MRDIFCSNCQKITQHKGAIDNNGEFVFTCQIDNCGSFLKFPASTSKTEFEELIKKNEEANKGQISIAEQEERLETLLD